MKIKEQNSTQAGAVLLISAIIVKLIGALFKIPLSADYVLGDLGFGYFSAVYDLYIPVYTLALSGFPVAIAKMTADFIAKRDSENTRKIFSMSFKALLCLGVIGSFAFLSLAPITLLEKGGNSFYSHLAAAPSVIFCCIISVYRGYFEGLKNMVPTAVSNVIEALGKLLLGLSGAFIAMKLTGDPALSSAMALAGITLGSVASCLYLKFQFKQNNTFDSKVNLKEKVYDKELLKTFLALLIPVAIASLTVGITAFVDSLTLIPQLEHLIVRESKGDFLLKGTLYYNISSEKIPTLLYGTKGKAHTLFNLVPTLTAALGVGAVPMITHYYIEDNKQELKKNVDLCLKFSAVLCMPIAFGFMSVGEGITQLLYGAKSAELGGKLLSVYGVAALFGGMAVPATSLLQALGKQKNALLNIAAGLGVKLICNLCLTPIKSINVYAAAIGTSVCFVVIFLLNMVGLVRSFGFLPNIKDSIFKPLIASLLCGMTAVTVQNITGYTKFSIIFTIMLAGVVYLAVLCIFKTIRKSEICEILKK